jgi:hypothetical protein
MPHTSPLVVEYALGDGFYANKLFSANYNSNICLVFSKCGTSLKIGTSLEMDEFCNGKCSQGGRI